MVKYYGTINKGRRGNRSLWPTLMRLSTYSCGRLANITESSSERKKSPGRDSNQVFTT
jgi:hypothetical protein